MTFVAGFVAAVLAAATVGAAPTEPPGVHYIPRPEALVIEPVELGPTDLLDAVASAFAGRPITVVCRSAEEDSTLTYAWGYVVEPLQVQIHAVVLDAVCAGALALAADGPATDYMKALGVEVIVHEAYHLRNGPGQGNEARTECRAMRHLDVGLVKLGASDGTLRRLMPLALLNSWRLRAITEDLSHQPAGIFGSTPTYHRSGCDMPLRYDRFIGFPPRED